MMTVKRKKPTKRKTKSKSQSKEVRQRFNWIIIGINGTGKSVFTQKAIKALKWKRILIVTFSGAPEIWQDYDEIDIEDRKLMANFTGIRTVRAIKYKRQTLAILYENFRNGLIVFDDCKPYIKPNLDHTPGLTELFADFRHHGIDMCFVLHSVTQVPPEVWNHSKYAFIGKTNRIMKANFELDRVDEVRETQFEVNKLFKIAEDKGGTAKFGLFKRIKL